MMQTIHQSPRYTAQSYLAATYHDIYEANIE